MKKPLIGITLDHETSESYSAYPWYALRENYITAVVETGGIPIALPYGVGFEDHYSDIIDGLIITGGNFDIDPSFYNEGVISDKVITKDNRTGFEFSITKAMLAKNKPILGICGGEQLLNVIFGGSLIQHIPDSVEQCLEHEQKNPKHLPSHEIELVPGTLLHKIIGSNKSMVNSTHHQAVKKPGDNIIASAFAPDRVIEAIEHSEYKFCLGVQWHPEYLTTEDDYKIFNAFIRECNV